MQGPGRLNICGDSDTTSNWVDNTITFKKVLFTGPVTVTTNTNYESDVLNETIIHANEQTRIYFDRCMLNGLTGGDTNYATFTTNITTNSAASTDEILLYDINGNLITTREGIFDAINFRNLSPEEQRKQEFIRRIRNKQAPAILNHRGKPARSAHHQHRFADVKPQELIALQLLRKMVAPDVFKKYLKHGFVIIQGPSGLIYQIRRGIAHIIVRKHGQPICELCVILKDRTIPPTDEVIAKMIIVECDEIDIWRRANVYWKHALKTFKNQLTSARHLEELMAA